MINLLIVAILVTTAGIANAVMDKLQFHYSKSIFSNKPTWNPKKSWENKWKRDENGDPIPGKEKFPLSSTALVFLTDAWHFFQFVMLSCFTLAIIIYDPSPILQTPLLPNSSFWNTVLLTIIQFSILKVIFSLSFEYFFSKVFTLKETNNFVQIGELLPVDYELTTTIPSNPVTINMKELRAPRSVKYSPMASTNNVIKTNTMTDVKRTPGAVLRDIECYSANVSELAKELRMQLIDPVTDQFKPVTLEFAVAVINTTVAKFKETMAECEGNPDFMITLPDGTVGTVMNIVLELLGIDL